MHTKYYNKKKSKIINLMFLSEIKMLTSLSFLLNITNITIHNANNGDYIPIVVDFYLLKFQNWLASVAWWTVDGNAILFLYIKCNRIVHCTYCKLSSTMIYVKPSTIFHSVRVNGNETIFIKWWCIRGKKSQYVLAIFKRCLHIFAIFHGTAHRITSTNNQQLTNNKKRILLWIAFLLNIYDFQSP